MDGEEIFDDQVFGYQEAWADLGCYSNVVLGHLRSSREVRLPLSSVASFVSDYRDEVFPDEENHCHKGAKFRSV